MDQAMRTLVTLSLLLIRMGLQAQEWAPVGATWHYAFFQPFNTTGHVIFEVVGDTVIEGQTTRKVSRTTQYYDGFSQQYGSFERPPIFTHSDGGIVWIYVPEEAEFDTLYHLNAIPGAHWSLAALPQPVVCQPESRVEVIDTGTTMISGVPLRWLAVEMHYIEDVNEQIVPDTLVERLGFTGSYMLPHDFCNGFIDGAEGGALLCYTDAEVDFANPLFVDCENGLSSGPDLASSAISIYPNPGLDGFMVDRPEAQVGTWTVRDAWGRAILELNAGSALVSVDAHSWAKGVYSVVWTGRPGRYASSVWVKQ
jgi:hypothetical protein